VAKDTQYSQIVEMLSRLQVQATADAQQRNSEKDQWVRDTGVIQQTITTLRSEVCLPRRTYSGLAPRIRDGFGTLANETGDGALDLAP